MNVLNSNLKMYMEMVKMKTIGVLTSGGDAPGMNAAVRAVVRTAILRVYAADITDLLREILLIWMFARYRI